MGGEEVFRCERAKGSSIGATIVGFFGAVWLMLGLVSAGHFVAGGSCGRAAGFHPDRIPRCAGAEAASEDRRSGNARKEADDARVHDRECRAVGRNFRSGESACKSAPQRMDHSRDCLDRWRSFSSAGTDILGPAACEDRDCDDAVRGGCPLASDFGSGHGGVRGCRLDFVDQRGGCSVCSVSAFRSGKRKQLHPAGGWIGLHQRLRGRMIWAL